MRRLIVPVVSVAAAAVCGVGAYLSLGLREQAAAEPGLRPQTPLLSARRVPPLLQSLAADGTLRQDLESVVARSQPSTCLMVERKGRVLYEHAGDMPLIPASNEKLLTATAALRLLGPAARLTTRVAGPPPDAAGTVHGDLYLVGGGDPLLATDAYRLQQPDPALGTRLEQLADRVAASGVRRVEGRLLGDESRYDTLRTVPSWRSLYVSDHESGPLSALTVNDGWVSFPSKDTPNAPVKASTVPAADAAAVFADLLTKRGVTVTGGTGSGTVPGGSRELARVDSLPLSDIVKEMLTQSDNQTAELVLKEIGHSAGAGSTAGGIAAMHRLFDSVGISRAATIQVDGSGLDRGNRATCRFLLQVLDLSGPVSPLAADLPVAGQVGTLRGWFTGTPVVGRLRAKTGTLDDVTALSGFVQTVPGESLTFTYLTNGKPKTPMQAAALNDLGLALVAYPKGVDRAAISPAAPR